ncbi:MAG: fumarylacetoacetate hydrolase family protein [Bdellovibrionales bacterium]|nr:fumarylacetoacetate hydrolase family protein [Bdellovibrionales bacterium]
MGYALVRFEFRGGPGVWGLLMDATVAPFPKHFDTLRDLLREDWRGLLGRVRARGAGTIPANEVRFLSPVTQEAQVLCQGKNYLAHLKETGVRPENKEFNLIFTKASSALAPPEGVLPRPSRVKLLDYELELGLVLARDVTEPVRVTEENLGEFVAGVVMANDVSARDVQVPERQWFKGKSFRGFCPVGPVLWLFEPGEALSLHDLNLELRVNGEVRQKASTRQLLHRPEETLTELSEIVDLRCGDLLLTGTPGGVAMRIRKTLWSRLRGKFLEEHEKMVLFLEEQAGNPRYLRDGDVIESTIRSADGGIDLGRQRLVVCGPARCSSLP